MRKITYLLLAVCAVVVLLISVSSFYDGNKQQGQVLSGRAVSMEAQKKVASESVNPKDYLTKVAGLISQSQLLTEFPKETEAQKQLAEQFTNSHEQLLKLSVPAFYQQFHLRLTLLTGQLSLALNAKDYQQFVSAQIELQRLADQYPQMF